MPPLQLSATLLRSIRSRAGQITQLAKSLAPKHVAPTIKTSVDEISEGKIRIRVDAKAPDARAQEYGSGLHSQKGAKQKYPIVPKTKKFLAFQWDIAEAHPEVAKFLPDGRFYIDKVNHPGIEAVNEGKGYIRPAISEFRKSLRKNGQINQEIKQAILRDIKGSFSGAKKNG